MKAQQQQVRLHVELLITVHVLITTFVYILEKQGFPALIAGQVRILWRIVIIPHVFPSPRWTQV